jgi:hypothetical protein
MRGLAPVGLAILVVLCSGMGQLSARAQSFDSSSQSSPQSFQPVSFRIRLQPAVVPPAVALVGGKPADQNHVLEAQIAQTVFEVVERLKTQNPHQLDIPEFIALIERTEMVLSNEAKEFEVEVVDHSDAESRGKSGPATQLQRRDAKNYFAMGEALIKFYRPAWEKAYRDGMDVGNLIYHEFLPYFFGHDGRYEGAKQIGFRKLPAPVFENMKDGDYRQEPYTDPQCLMHIEFDRQRKVVAYHWINNYLTGRFCLVGRTPIAHVCAANEVRECVFSNQSASQQLLTMHDPQHGEVILRSLDDHQGILVGGGPFVRVDDKAPRKEISEFRVFGFSQDRSLSYAEMCDQAFANAEAEAARTCRMVFGHSAQSCEIIHSEIMRLDDFDGVDYCRVQAIARVPQGKR